jgi:hypothetical protein
MLALLFGSLDPALRLALDFRDESWAGVELPPNAAVVNRPESNPAFGYLRFRDPPYDEAALRSAAAAVRSRLDEGLEVFAYFRHEDEATAPDYAGRLRTIVYGL